MHEFLSRLTHDRRAGWWLVALVVAVYAHSAIQNGFAYDDHRFIAENPYIESPDSLRRAFTDPATVDPLPPYSIVRPLRTLEYVLDQRLGGSAVVFHLHSLAWHLLAALLAFRLITHLVADRTAAWLGAAMWAVHPMQTESVAFISSRGDVAMGACTIGALLLATGGRIPALRLAAALAVGALAMLYKETAIVLPLLVVVVAFVRDDARTVKQAAARAWPFFALSIGYWIWRESVRVGELAHAAPLGGSTQATFATMFRAVGAYIGFGVIPVRPAIDWTLPVSTSLVDSAGIAWMLVHVAIVAGAVRFARTRPLLVAGVALFYVPLIPVANWPVNLGIPTAERFLYLPLLALGVAVAAAVRRQRALAMPVAIAVVACAMLSAARATEWRDDRTLMEATVAVHESPRAHSFLGATLREEALQREGLERRKQLEASLAHSLASVDAWYELIASETPQHHAVWVPLIDASYAARLLGRNEQALSLADAAIAVSPNLPLGHYNRAWTLLRLRRAPAAMNAYEEALRLEMSPPPSDVAEFFLDAGAQLEAAGDNVAARHAYATVYALDLNAAIKREAREGMRRTQ